MKSLRTWVQSGRWQGPRFKSPHSSGAEAAIVNGCATPAYKAPFSSRQVVGNVVFRHLRTFGSDELNV